MKKRYLEDFSAGERFQNGPLLITQEKIQEFAREYDPQVFHLDPVGARESLFGTLVASGWQTAALSMRLLVESGINIAGGVIGLGLEEVRWPKPVLPGDSLTTETEILEINPSRTRPDRGTLKARTVTRNQKNEIVLQMTAVLIVPRARIESK